MVQLVQVINWRHFNEDEFYQRLPLKTFRVSLPVYISAIFAFVFALSCLIRSSVLPIYILGRPSV